MNIHAFVFRLFVAGLVLLLSSCGSTRLAAPSLDEGLTGFVLVIEEALDGQVSHSWHHASEFDLSRYDHFASTGGAVGSIVLASHRPRDCDQEQIDCFQACMKRRLPSYQSHIKRVDGSKQRFCERECLDEYMDCLELQKSRALQFNAVDDAVEWLKRNRKGLLIGAIVVIAGVAFVTLSAGAGAVVLAPIVLVAA
jgi:hypothetical protein